MNRRKVNEKVKGKRIVSPEKKTRAPRVKLPDDVMHALVGKGKTNLEIIQILREEHGVRTNQQAVSKWRARHNYKTRQPTKERLELIPWRVTVKHTRSRFYKGLANEAQARAGKPLSRPTKLSMARFQEELDRRGRDVVIHYDRTNGWAFVPRREGIDKDLIRDPRFADNGKPIEDPELWQ